MPGDVIRHADSAYLNTRFASGEQYHPSSLYAMTLQGDPALILWQNSPTAVGLHTQQTGAATSFPLAGVALFLMLPATLAAWAFRQKKTGVAQAELVEAGFDKSSA